MSKKTGKSLNTAQENENDDSPMPDLVNGLVELITPADNLSFKTSELMTIKTLTQKMNFCAKNSRKLKISLVLIELCDY